MISRDKIEEIIFEKLVVASLVTIAGMLIILLFNTEKEKANFVAQYSGYSVEIQKDAFQKFSTAINNTLFVLRKAASDEENASGAKTAESALGEDDSYIASDEAINILASSTLAVETLAALSAGSEDFGTQIETCAEIFRNELNQAAFDGADYADKRIKITNCYNSAAKKLAKWFGKTAIKSYEIAEGISREKYSPTRIVARPEAILALVALLLLAISICIFYLRSKPNCGQVKTACRPSSPTASPPPSES